VEPPVPFPFPPAPPSHRITIVSWSAACACLAAIIGAARVSPLFFSHILFKSILFLSSNSFFSILRAKQLYLTGLDQLYREQAKQLKNQIRRAEKAEQELEIQWRRTIEAEAQAESSLAPL
jgi:hypothetical protein